MITLERRPACRGPAGRDDGIVIGEGAPGDIARLARFHYRAGAPATCVRILVARDWSGGCGCVAGVLAVSMPVLNGPWRERLWPGLLAGLSARGRAARINAEVRCISRVIVDPRYRGLGVARRLVGAYLSDPVTVRTEAIAAVGAVCPFFERAGMRAVPVPISARDRRLGAFLRINRVQPWTLMEVSCARAALAASAGLTRALRIWARASKQTREWAEAPVPELWPLLVRAAGGLCARAMAYGFDAGTAGGGAHGQG